MKREPAMSEQALPAPPPGRRPAVSRRRSPRRPASRLAHVTCRKGASGLSPDLAVRLLDLSETGASLLLREAVDVAQEVEITFSAPGFSRPLKLLASVIRCEPSADGYVRAGVHFQKPVSYRDLHRLTPIH